MKLDDRRQEHLDNPVRPNSLDPNSYQFFEGHLHDGYVYSAQRDGSRLEIAICDCVLEDFADQFFGEIEVEHEDVQSPVRLVFEGVNYVNAVRADAEGWLKWDDWERWRPVTDRSQADTFVRGWFSEQDGHLQWIGYFRKWVPNLGNLDTDLFLLVDCERATAKPESERVLRKKMGDDCYEAYAYINSLPPEEMWLARGHLRRYLESKGIPIRHIPHQSER